MARSILEIGAERDRPGNVGDTRPDPRIEDTVRGET